MTRRTLVEDRLTQLEQNARAELARLTLPTDVVALYDCLASEPLPVTIAADDLTRVHQILFELKCVESARRSLAIGDAAGAADFAMRAVMHASNAQAPTMIRDAFAADRTRRRRKGGLTRGQQQRAAAAKSDHAILTLVDHWQQSDDLQADYRTAVAYICDVKKQRPRTVYRALARATAASTQRKLHR